MPETTRCKSLAFYTEQISKDAQIFQLPKKKKVKVEDEVLTEDEIETLLVVDPDALRGMLPEDHPEQCTIDIAVDWAETGVPSEVTQMIKKSLDKLESDD